MNQTLLSSPTETYQKQVIRLLNAASVWEAAKSLMIVSEKDGLKMFVHIVTD